MLNIAYTHASVVLVIFNYYMLQNKRSNSHSYSMTLVVVLFDGVTKILPKKLYCFLSDLPNTTIKMLDKILFHKHFKTRI